MASPKSFSLIDLPYLPAETTYSTHGCFQLICQFRPQLQRNFLPSRVVFSLPLPISSVGGEEVLNDALDNKSQREV